MVATSALAALLFQLPAGSVLTPLADPGINHGTLTASQSRPADTLPPLRSATLDVCVASSIAAQLAEMLRRRHLIVNFRNTGMKSENFDNRTFTTRSSPESFSASRVALRKHH